MQLNAPTKIPARKASIASGCEKHYLDRTFWMCLDPWFCVTVCHAELSRTAPALPVWKHKSKHIVIELSPAAHRAYAGKRIPTDVTQLNPE